jgi:CheY-like chemotaxis protein
MPTVLVIADLIGQETVLPSALEHASWRVEQARDGANARAIAADAPLAVILVDLDEPLRGSQLAASIRAIQGPSAAAPILGLRRPSTVRNGPVSIDVDTVLMHDADVDSLVQTLENWRPVSLAPTRRIAQMLGAGPVAGMIERLARRLEAALTILYRGSFDKAEAHRLAGLCGTLGFGQAHAAWLDLSLGDDSAIAEVRRTTRLTLSAIARGL